MGGVEKGKELRGSRKTSLKPGDGRVISLDGEDFGKHRLRMHGGQVPGEMLRCLDPGWRRCRLQTQRWEGC